MVLNAKLVFDEIYSWIAAADSPVVLWFTVVPLALGAAGLLLYITFMPFVRSLLQEPRTQLHAQPGALPVFEKKQFQRIAVAIDFSDIDEQVLHYAMSLGTPETSYLLIHVVESPGAILLGEEIRDKETNDDEERLRYYADELAARGIKAEIFLGFGNPKASIPKAVNDFNADLLVLGAHGHRFFNDLIFGTTVDSVRHNVNIPVFIVREER